MVFCDRLWLNPRPWPFHFGEVNADPDAKHNFGLRIRWVVMYPYIRKNKKKKQHAATCVTCFHNRFFGVSWYFLVRCHWICHWGKKQLRWVLHYLDLIWNIMTLVLLGSTCHRQFVSDSWHLTTSKHRRNDLWLRLVAVDTIFLPVRISGIYRDPTRDL